MISKETIFDTLFEENMKTDPKLLDLNQRILKLENEFKGKYGDEIFYKAPDLIEKIIKMPLGHSLPALCEMLFVHDSGRHEASGGILCRESGLASNKVRAPALG